VKKLAIAAIITVGTVAAGAEILRATLSGVGTQSAVVGRGAKVALQCTTSVRYQTSNAALTPTLSANDALIATGDPYRIDLPPGHDRIFVAHSDLATSISCSIFTRDP